jgi:hypothetical protein
MLLVIGSKLFPWNGDVGRMWRSGRGITMVGIGSQAGRSYLLVMGVGTIPMSVRVYSVLTLNGTSLFILLIFQHNFRIFIFGKALKFVVCWRMFM